MISLFFKFLRAFSFLNLFPASKKKNIYRSFSDAFHFVYSSACSTIHIAGPAPRELISSMESLNLYHRKFSFLFFLIPVPEILYRLSNSFPETSKLFRDRLNLLRHFIVVLFFIFLMKIPSSDSYDPVAFLSLLLSVKQEVMGSFFMSR